MSSFTITFDGPSFEDFANICIDASESLSDMEPFLRDREDDWIASRRLAFNTSGFGTWSQPTAGEARYMRFKHALGGGNRLLVFKSTKYNGERLKDSLTQKRSRDYVFRVIDPMTVTMGTKVPYAKDILHGSHTDRWGGTTSPARDFLVFGTFDDDLKQAMEEKAEEIEHMIAEGEQ